MSFFTNLIPLNKSVYIEYPSVVRGYRLIEAERDEDTGDILVWAGRLHAVISPSYC